MVTIRKRPNNCRAHSPHKEKTMLRIQGHQAPNPPLKSPIVTLGTFDGVHIGHQKLIRELVSWAHRVGGDAIIITFDQHPRVVLSGLEPLSITSLEHRLVLFERLGVDACVVLEFNKDLASVSAEDFALQYFRDWLNAQGALLGFDCRFGRGARGNIDLLQKMSPDLGMEVRAFEQQSLGSLVPSSTAIRKAIRTADLQAASAMLGRPVSILGQVVEGDRRGSQIGFPTANIDPHHEILPPFGVYACTVSIDGKTYKAVSNIGVRPTVVKNGEPTVESHFLDFEGDLYGQVLEVEFHSYLRPEKQFNGLDELRTQISKDTEQARRVLEELP